MSEQMCSDRTHPASHAIREEAVTTSDQRRERFTLDSALSAVLVEARSNVGRVRFGTTDISGTFEVTRCGDRLDTTHPPIARLSIPISSLTSGNSLYDAELHHRLAVRRHPRVTLNLLETELVEGSDYSISGEMTLREATTVLHGALTVTFPEPDVMRLIGEHVLDVREFGIELPSVLMLRIYPEVTVSIQLLARVTSSTSGGT